MTDRYAVIGHPVSHSQSPWIHAEFARQTQQALDYGRIEAPLDGFAKAADAFRAAGDAAATMLAVLREGALYANIQASLLGSPEFLGRVGGSRSRFLDSAYVFTLGRLPDPSGRNYWNQQMDRGLSRADVALVLATSPESRYRLVDAYYRTFLHRPVDPEGGTYWALSMALLGMREEVVLAALVGGEEFKALNG